MPDRLDPQDDRRLFPSLSSPSPRVFTLKEPIPPELVDLGWEVVAWVLHEGMYSLFGFREAAKAVSRTLNERGVRVRPRDLYYTALRVKWMKDSTRS